MNTDSPGNSIRQQLGTWATKLDIHAVRRSDTDPLGYEVMMGDVAVLSQVTKEDAHLLRGLITLRVMSKKGRPNFRIRA